MSSRDAMSTTKNQAKRSAIASRPECSDCPDAENFANQIQELREAMHTLEVGVAERMGEFAGEFRSFRHEMKTMLTIASHSRRGIDIEETSPPPASGTQELKTPLGRLRASPLVIVLVIALAAVTAGVSYVAGEVGVARVKQGPPKP